MLASQALVAQNIAFGIIAAIMIFGAFRVVTTKNVVHAALWLVMVLFLFGVMLTRARIGAENDLNNKHSAIGIPVALLMFVAMSIALIKDFKTHKLPSPSTAVRVDTRLVSDSIFGPYLLPFWALSFVLLVAVIGAIVLARKD